MTGRLRRSLGLSSLYTGLFVTFSALKIVGPLRAPWIFVCLLPIGVAVGMLGFLSLVATVIAVLAEKFEDRLA